jgi:hypothetical protein
LSGSPFRFANGSTASAGSANGLCRVGTIAGVGPALEIAFMMLGTGPGSHEELDHAKRISMKYD